MSTAAIEHVRERWRMGTSARAMVVLVATLLAIGLGVLYSASAMTALQEGRSSAFYLFRQMTGLAVGTVAFAIAAKMDADRYYKWAWPMMAASILMMLLTVLPFTEAIAPPINGSRRFLWGGSVQPSEFAKLAVVTWTAMLVVKKGDRLRRLTKGLLPFLVVIGLLALIALLEPDLSAAMMFLLVMGVVLFAGGARIGHFVLLSILLVPVAWGQVEKLSYALMRLTTFFDPTFVADASRYQLKQSLIAVGSGGAFGVGFGQGLQQLGFLPFQLNDFVASTVGEEFGFLGITFLTLAFVAYGYLGFRIARQARSPFLSLVAVGLTFTTVLTAFLHIGVVIGLLPTTGLTLPFVSYGRSNLVLSLLTTGILVNIGSYREKVIGEHATDPSLSPVHSA
ncbi:MAG TPA: putative peptidoglycan glycosyltransferase FtsW [Gemmatimonadales bacterium]|nr:putative peptidoglycan glycosyltransferase FtsW [Gemmatimonadales bacterium]